MYRILLILIVLPFHITAQTADSIKPRILYKYFLSINYVEKNDIIIALAKKDNIEGEGLHNSKYFLEFISVEDGSIQKEIMLADTLINCSKVIVSHDGSSLILISYERKWEGPSSGMGYLINYFARPEFEGKTSWMVIQKYSLRDDKWVWKKEFFGKEVPLDMTFQADDKKIIGVTCKYVFQLDAETGTIINESDEIKSISDFRDGEFVNGSLSPGGRYFTFSTYKYLAHSRSDETGCCLGLDYLLYGIKLLFYNSSIPNYLYVWDINNDRLYAELKIPYKSERLTVIYNKNESKFWFNDPAARIVEYSLKNKKELKTLDIISNSLEEIERGTVSGVLDDDNCLVRYSNSKGYDFIDLTNGKIKLRYPSGCWWSNSTAISLKNNRISFIIEIDNKEIYSEDMKEKYILRGNSIIVLEKDTWKKVWEKNLQNL